MSWAILSLPTLQNELLNQVFFNCSMPVFVGLNEHVVPLDSTTGAGPARVGPDLQHN